MYIYLNGGPPPSPDFSFRPDYRRDYREKQVSSSTKAGLGVLRKELLQGPVKKVVVKPVFRRIESLELPDKLFSFDVGKYTPNNEKEADATIQKVAEEIKKGMAKGKQMKVDLGGVADNTLFTTTTVGGKQQILIERTGTWKEDFSRALKNMDKSGGLKTVMASSPAEYLKLSNGLKTKGVEAITDLPIATQQLVMNHAVCHSRGEFAQNKLTNAIGKIKGVTFTISTEQTNKKGTRSAKISAVSEEIKKPQPDIQVAQPLGEIATPIPEQPLGKIVQK